MGEKARFPLHCACLRVRRCASLDRREQAFPRVCDRLQGAYRQSATRPTGDAGKEEVVVEKHTAETIQIMLIVIVLIVVVGFARVV
ncbi:hypothetical protein GCM10010428_34720 [Actinosynnema pretiosum subsp. pretiosum]